MAGAQAPDSRVADPEAKQSGAMALVTSLFFMWGFLTCMNDILIPYMKGAFDLTYFKAMLVQSAFFAAYFVGSAIYFVISIRSGDPIARIGYKHGMVLGLSISGIGALLFYPAAALVSYPFFLTALFVLALGITMLQISANPYVAVLGPERTASSRLNLSQGFNSLGTTLAPLIGGYLIFTYFAGDGAGAESVKVPYLIFAGILFGLALVFGLMKLPRVGSKGEKIERRPIALKFPNLTFGMGAIFCYVGAEVAIGSILISFFMLDEIAGLSEEQGSLYVAVYWGGLMIGRFLGAISLSEIRSNGMKAALMAGAAIGCFLLILLAIHSKDETFGFEELWPFSILIAVNYLAFFVGRSLPHRTLTVFALFCVALLLLTVYSSGKFAMWSVLGIGLFNSIMWSNIFTLAIRGLGKHTSQASSLLIMMIIGGALVPPLQGLLADQKGVQMSFLLPIAAYLYLAIYGMRGHRFVQPVLEA